MTKHSTERRDGSRIMTHPLNFCLLFDSECFLSHQANTKAHFLERWKKKKTNSWVFVTKQASRWANRSDCSTEEKKKRAACTAGNLQGYLHTHTHAHTVIHIKPKRILWFLKLCSNKSSDTLTLWNSRHFCARLWM